MAEKSKPAPWKGLSNLAQAITFIVIEVLIVLTLDGWMAVALWVIITRNALWLALALYGMAVLAVEASNERDRLERERARAHQVWK